MSLNNNTVNEFLEILSSDAPSPGGGSASALLAAIGTSLIHMVASLTTDKEKFIEHQELVNEVLDKSNKYQIEYQKLIDEDVKAFEEVSKVFSMPKENDEQKKQRRIAMQKALKNAINPPLKIMELINDTLELICLSVDKFNQNALSDLGVASLSLDSALKGAYLNVLINLKSIKSEEFVSSNRKKADDLLDENSKKAIDLFNKIKGKLV